MFGVKKRVIISIALFAMFLTFFLVILALSANGDAITTQHPMVTEDEESSDDLDTAALENCCVSVFISLLIGVFVARWVSRDAKKRQEDGTIYVILVLVLSFIPFVGIAIGGVIWLLARPDWTMFEETRTRQIQYPQAYPQSPPHGTRMPQYRSGMQSSSQPPPPPPPHIPERQERNSQRIPPQEPPDEPHY